MKNRGILYAGLLLAGVAMAVAGGLLPGLSRQVSGILIGAGSGLFGVGLARLITALMERKNPEYGRRADIERRDERNIAINTRAKARGFDAMSVVLGVLMLTYILMGADLTEVLLLVAAYLMINGVQIYCLLKYSKDM